MKFQIYRTLNYQPNYEKILEDYPTLANYNLKKDDAGNCYIIINSIKQLTQLVKEINQEIILSPCNDGIEIFGTVKI